MDQSVNQLHASQDSKRIPPPRIAREKFAKTDQSQTRMVNASSLKSAQKEVNSRMENALLRSVKKDPLLRTVLASLDLAKKDGQRKITPVSRKSAQLDPRRPNLETVLPPIAKRTSQRTKRENVLEPDVLTVRL